MVFISDPEYNRIAKILEECFCCHCSAYMCSEADCDIQSVYEVLDRYRYRECVFDCKMNDMGIDEELPFDL